MWTMPQTKEIKIGLRLRIVNLHKAGKGYKSISKSLDVHQSTVRQIVYKWRKFSTVATLPRSCRPAKMTSRAQRRMLNEVKKNPRVSAKDLQRSLEHANIGEDTAVQKKHCCTSEVCRRAPGCSTTLLWKYSVDRWSYSWVVWKGHTTLCVEKKMPSTPTSKPHPNCKVWWREHHGLGLLCYLRAWTACYQWQKNEFPSSSRHFAWQCPPIKAQQKLGDATRHQPKTQ